jgi:hypothetical protein
MEFEGSSKLFVPIYRITQHHNKEDNNLKEKKKFSVKGAFIKNINVV